MLKQLSSTVIATCTCWLLVLNLLKLLKMCAKWAAKAVLIRFVPSWQDKIWIDLEELWCAFLDACQQGNLLCVEDLFVVPIFGGLHCFS